MAKKKKGGGMVRYVPRVIHAARRGVSRTKQDKDILAAAVAAWLLGKAEASGMKLPTIGGLDAATSTGLILYAGSRFGVGGRWARTGAVAALSVGAYRMGTGKVGILGTDVEV